jgi:hypothetical protein
MDARDKKSVPSGTKPDSDDNLGRGAPAIETIGYVSVLTRFGSKRAVPKTGHRSTGSAAQDLDREDAHIQREGVAGEKPAVKPTKMPESKKPGPDRT